MPQASSVQIGSVEVGGDAPLALLAGLNVLETESGAIEHAQRIGEIAARHGFPLVFKASFDKANRTRSDAFRGPGMNRGLEWLASVKAKTGFPIITDVHDPAQAAAVARVADCLQIPAFLCRQTDLIVACAETGRPLNIKKAQFIAAPDLEHAVVKAREVAGSAGAMVTERGSSFGYNNLVADMRGLIQMRAYAPVCFDATHAVQYPGARGGASGGDRRYVRPLARAAVATGLDALFVEAHPDPENAPCDGPSQLDYADFERLLVETRAIDDALREIPGQGA